MFKTLLACSTLFALAAIPPVRSAQIDVTVGGNGIIQYTPNNVTANPGDIVVFTFQQKNHTVTQSSFATPCSPLAGGFDSGFVPVAADVTTGFPVAQFQVQDTNPVWVYCKQTGHCSQGMVFAINPGTQMAAFQAAAIATGNATNATTTSSSVTSSATSSSTSTAQSVDHTVVVGGTGKIFYSPSNITANPGDTVTFQFQQKNHTVTQSSFATPCRALASTSTTGQVGFDSGFMPVADNATTFPTYTIQVNDTSPIWAYCKQTAHCGEGMVFSVNSNEASTNNFAAFLNNAKTQNGSATTTSTSSSSSSTSSASGASSRHTASRSIVGAAVTLGAFAIGLML